MTLIRWSPVRRNHDLLDLHRDVDRLIGGLLEPFATTMTAPPSLAPAVDVEETPEAFVFRADLPGMRAQDLKVSLEGDTLTLRGERRREEGGEDEHVRRVERAYGVFQRAFTLGSPVRGDQVRATYRDGVLEVRVPKADEARAREIEVQVG